jgi:3-phosphoinositide dependent protein kinase-1
MTPFYTFENITSGKYEIPSSVPLRAKDLIEKLLIVEPTERLGAGSFFGDKENSMEVLMNHPFFEGINFPNLIKETAPINNS